MNRSELLKVAIGQAKNDSINSFPGQVVCVYCSPDYEFTIIPEAKAEKFLEIEPKNSLVMKLLDGKPL